MNKLISAILVSTVILGVSVFGVLQTFAAVSLNMATVTATGGNAISADTAGGTTYTALTGPVISENALGEIGLGTIVLNAPAGFSFRTTVNVTATRTNSGSCTGTGNKPLLLNGVASQSVTPTASTITITVTQASSGNATNCKGKITWSGIRVQPENGTPLVGGNITNSGTSVINGIASGTNFGELVEVVGVAKKLVIAEQPTNTGVNVIISPAVTVRVYDKSNNPVDSSASIKVALNKNKTNLLGVATLPAVSGVATFSDLKVSMIATGYTLTATSTGLTSSGASNLFNITSITTVTPSVTASNKVYDSTNGTGITGCSLTGVLPADIGNVTCSATSATFSDANVGNGKTVSATGISLSGIAAGMYQLSSTTASTTANITARPITVTASTNSKPYDGSTSASAIPTITSGSLVGTDATAFTENYNNKNVGVGKTLIPSGSVTDGNGGNNYAITFVNDTTGEITSISLGITDLVANSKTYDGNSTAALDSSSAVLTGVVAGDEVALDFSAASASFADKIVGTAKSISVSGISISGTDSGNYNLDISGLGLTANILPKSLTVSATGVNKVYDETTNAVANLATDALSGDDVNASGTASFDDANVGVDKAVHVVGISLSGVDAANYALSNTTAETTANITEFLATITLDKSNLTRVYNGTAQSVDVLSTDPSGLPYSTTYDGLTTLPTSAGTYSILAAITDTNYSGTDSATLVINKADQVITFETLPDKFFGDANFEISATSNSGLSVGFTTSSTACSLAGVIVAIAGVGDCTITANQLGDSNFNTAPEVSQTFHITDNTAPVITLIGNATNQVAINNPFTDLGATAIDNVDGPVTVTVGGDTVNTAVAGTYTITYDAVDATLNHATQKTRTVKVQNVAMTFTTTPNEDGSLWATLVDAITASAVSSGITMTVTIPGGLTITGTSLWDGSLNLPNATLTFRSPTPDSGFTASVLSSVEIGSSTNPLTFDKGIRIMFAGEARRFVGWSVSDVFTLITSTCSSDSQAVGDALPTAGDCKIDVGSDLVVWTKHFTTFMTYSQTAIPAPSPAPSSGGGGGSGFVPPAPAPTPSTSTGSQTPAPSPAPSPAPTPTTAQSANTTTNQTSNFQNVAVANTPSSSGKKASSAAPQELVASSEPAPSNVAVAKDNSQIPSRSPFLASISNVFTLGTGNNIVGFFVVLIVLSTVIFIARMII